MDGKSMDEIIKEMERLEQPGPSYPVAITSTVVNGEQVFEIEYSDGTKVVAGRERAFYAAVEIHARQQSLRPSAAPATNKANAVSPKMIRNPNAQTKAPPWTGLGVSPAHPPKPADPAPRPSSPYDIEQPEASQRQNAEVVTPPPAAKPKPNVANVANVAPNSSASPSDEGLPPAKPKVAAAAPGALATLINRTADGVGAIASGAWRGTKSAGGLLADASVKFAPIAWSGAATVGATAGASLMAGYRGAKSLIAQGRDATSDPYDRGDPLAVDASDAGRAIADADESSRPMMAAFFRSVAEYEQSVSDLYQTATGRDERSLDVPLAPPANDDFHMDGVVKLKPRSGPARPGAGTGFGAEPPTFAEALAGMPHAQEHVERCKSCLDRVGDRAELAVRELAGYDDSDAVRERARRAMQDAIDRANQRVRALFDGRDDHPLAEQAKTQSTTIGKLFEFLSSFTKARRGDGQEQEQAGPR